MHLVLSLTAIIASVPTQAEAISSWDQTRKLPHLEPENWISDQRQFWQSTGLSGGVSAALLLAADADMTAMAGGQANLVRLVPFKPKATRAPMESEKQRSARTRHCCVSGPLKELSCFVTRCWFCYCLRLLRRRISTGFNSLPNVAR